MIHTNGLMSAARQGEARLAAVTLFTTLPPVGGNSTIALTLAGHFRSQGRHVIVVVKEDRGYGWCPRTLAEIEQLGCRVLHWPVGRPGMAFARMLSVVSEEARKRRTVFVAVGMRWGAVVLAGLVRFEPSVFYMIQHDDRLGPVRALGPLARVFTHIGVITPASMAGTRLWMGRGASVLWLPQFSALKAPVISLPHDKVRQPVFGFVGQLTESKGVAWLLDMWRRYPALPPLLFAGDGPLRAEVESAAKGDPRIRHAGAFSASEREHFLPRFFGQITLLLMPSMRSGEGIPTVILEGLSLGVPALTSDKGGLAAFTAGLKPACAGVMDAVPLESLEAAVIDRAGRIEQNLAQVAANCHAYHRRWFSDQAVTERWDDLIASRSGGGGVV